MKRLCRILSVWLFIAFFSASAESMDLVMLQERLTDLGYEIGSADGILGTKTSAALVLAQTLLSDSGCDVSPTGYPDAVTYELIMQEENETLLRTLQRGRWGSRVRAVQNQLVELNLLHDSVDGNYGVNTESAVRAFEEKLTGRASGITVDGKLSAEEYDLLMSDLSVYGFEAPMYFDDEQPENLTGSFLYAKHACLINAVTGEVLLEKSADEIAEPASTTKIITLLTALSLCDPEEKIVVPDEAADVPADSSLVPVYPGETMMMSDLLYAMMIRSGNDAANAVAALCSGSVDSFVEQMNRKAQELGMNSSHFVNAHGYAAEEHYTTARDLVTAAREGMTQELFRKITTCTLYTLPATERRDALVLKQKWEIFDPESEYYIPCAAGIKSGYTSSAGFCYVGAYQEKGVTLIAAVMGGQRRNMAWKDLKRLFAYGMTR